MEDEVHRGHREERRWPTRLLTPQADTRDTRPAAPWARTTWHSLVSRVYQKCIWDKSCLRRKTWGSGHPLPSQSILSRLCNKLDCQKFYSSAATVEVNGNPPRPALLAMGALTDFEKYVNVHTPEILIDLAWDLPRLCLFVYLFNKNLSELATRVEYSSFKNIIWRW